MTANNCPHSLPCPVTTYRNMVAYFKWPSEITFEVKPGATVLRGYNFITNTWYDRLFGVFKNSTHPLDGFAVLNSKKLIDDLEDIAAKYPNCSIEEHIGDDRYYRLRPGSCRQLRDLLNSYIPSD